MLQLKITLNGIKPPVWRRVLVSESMNLLNLHDLIQAVFGWMDYHLHLFEVAGLEFVNTIDWEEDGERYEDDSRAKLGDLIPRFVPEGGSFLYTYDLGDNWEHTIRVEKVLPDRDDQKLPALVAGRRKCPPEDVGGPWGYAHFLEALQNSAGPDGKQLLEWIGGDFDPEDFDLAAVRRDLQGRMRQAELERGSSWPVGPCYMNFSSVVRGEWVQSIQPEDQAMARDLPLRGDMVTLLNYLAENKVRGTDATGNFPLKHIRAITADFVDPPVLDHKFRDRVYKLRTEDQVRPLKRLHLLACLAGLIHGGEKMRWVLTEQGAAFLELAPEEQVWFLFRTAFDHFFWIYDDSPHLDPDPVVLKAVLLAVFREYTPGVVVSMTDLASDFSTHLEIHIDSDDPQFAQRRREWLLERVFVEPFVWFGILERVEAVSTVDSYRFANLKAVRLTDFGQRLLPWLDFRHRRGPVDFSG